MSAFESLDHTADVGVAVRAESMDEFFRDAARGLFAVMLPHVPGGESQSHEVSLDAPDVETLLVDWLSELLYLFEAHRFVLTNVDFHSLSDTALKARCVGVTATDFSECTEVKAVTHHLLEVRKTDYGLEAEIYFDL